MGVDYSKLRHKDVDPVMSLESSLEEAGLEVELIGGVAFGVDYNDVDLEANGPNDKVLFIFEKLKNTPRFLRGYKIEQVEEGKAYRPAGCPVMRFRFTRARAVPIDLVLREIFYTNPVELPEEYTEDIE